MNPRAIKQVLKRNALPKLLLAAALLAGLACATAGAQPKPDGPFADSDSPAAMRDPRMARAMTQQEAAAKAEAETAAALAAAKAAAAAKMLAGEEVLQQRPVIAPLGAFDAPAPKETRLKNGLRLLVLEKAGAPMEALLFAVRRGSTSDPAGMAGLAAITTAMLETGSAKKSQAQMAEIADALGATLRTGATSDGSMVSVAAQPEKLKAMVALLAEVTLKPNFDPAEWKKLQAQRVAQLEQQLAEPRVAAQHAFANAVYAGQPLGHVATGTPASVKTLALEDVKSLWSGIDPGEVAVIAVGGAPEAAVVAALSAKFGNWKRSAKPRGEAVAGSKPAGEKGGAPGAAPDAPSRPRLVFVDFPGRPQSVLRVGQPSVPLASPDQLALRVLNSVLGGSFTSRLNQNLREKNGYSYGAGSTFAFGRGPGPFAAATSVKTEVTGLALGELLKEVERAVKEPLSAEELEKGKALLAYQLVEELQSSGQTAGLLGELFLGDVPMEELKTMVPRLKALTVAEVEAAAQRALAPGSMTIVIAGDAKTVLPQLEPLKLPAAERRGATGEKL